MNKRGHYRGQPLVDLSADPADLPPEPLTVHEGPLLPPAREPLHEAGCWCLRCWDAGLRYGEYLHAKKLEW